MALKNPVTEERYAAAQAATRERHVAGVKTAVDALVEALGRGEADAWDLVDKLRSEVARGLIDNAKLRHDLAKANTVVRAVGVGLEPAELEIAADGMLYAINYFGEINAPGAGAKKKAAQRAYEKIAAAHLIASQQTPALPAKETEP